MNLRIAICDDELQQRKKVLRLLKKYNADHPESVLKTTAFSAGNELLNYVDAHGGFDLYILDVLMPELDGIETGIALRNRNDNGLIIYLSSSSDFAMASYQAQAFHYILKPVEEHQFFNILDRACRQLDHRKPEVLSVKTKSAVRFLPLHTILYAELDNRTVRYYLTDGTTINSLTFRGAFHKEITPLLNHERFILCGSSFAVNLQYVTAMEKTGILLADGHQVPVSRNLYSAVKKQWMDYWTEE